MSKTNRYHYVRALTAACLGNVLLGISSGTAHGATLVQEFYLPMPEAQIRQTFAALGASTSTTMDTVFSVVVTGDGTIIHFDHWEDGYEVNLKKPVQANSQIWGDGNNANGLPPGFVNDPAGLPAGTVLALRNNVSLPRNPSHIRYDGRDRLAATKALVISRAAWATSPGSVLAGSVEVPSTIDYGTSYISPIGENMSNSLFSYVGLMIMAELDGTVVTIDRDGAGVEASFNVTLNKGESYLVNGDVNVGASVIANKRIQVNAVTGRVNARSWSFHLRE